MNCLTTQRTHRESEYLSWSCKALNLELAILLSASVTLPLRVLIIQVYEMGPNEWISNSFLEVWNAFYTFLMHWESESLSWSCKALKLYLAMYFNASVPLLLRVMEILLETIPYAWGHFSRKRFHTERSKRKWVLWILFYNIKFKFRNINAIGFLFLTQHTTPSLYVKIHYIVLHMRGTDVTRSDTP